MLAVCATGGAGGFVIAFSFGAPYGRQPVRLSHHWSYIEPSTRERAKAYLAEGCQCKHDGERTASFVIRRGAVWLQCDACGASIGTAMKRDHHHGSAEYPAWRNHLHEAYQAARDAYYEAQREGWKDEQRRAEEAFRDRVREYHEWLRTSPEWAAMRKRIFWRSRGHCEACLNGNAEVVHHLTYQFGALPPDWHLRAVCRGCHERLHDGDDDWCERGMAR